MRFYGAFVLIMIALVAGIAHAASTDPALQVTDYSTTPGTVYPGTSGQLQLTLSNGGGDTATRIAILYDNGPGGNSASSNIGDVAAGSAALASVPFSVPENDVSGVLVIHMNILYSDSTGTLSKTTPATISIAIAQHQALEVRTSSAGTAAISPGDKLTISLELANTGGVVRNAVIRAPENSSFMLDGASQLNVGDIGMNATREVNISMISSTSAASGRYLIPLMVDYQDALQNTLTQTVFVGPVSIADASAQFDIGLAPLTASEVGSEARFALTIKNRGTSAASMIIDLNQSSVFTPLGNNRIYVDNLQAGETRNETITLGIGPASAAGYYTLPVMVTANGKTYTQNLGIVVEASQEITMSTSTSPSFISSGTSGVAITAQIANTGNSPIRSVYVSALPSRNFEIAGATDKFVGTLNVDDFTTFQFTMNVPDRVPAGNYTLPIRITFRDSTNAEHTLEENVAITVYSLADATRLGGIASFSGNSTFSGRRNGGSGFFGVSLLTPLNIGIGIAVLIAAYFGYRKLKPAARKN